MNCSELVLNYINDCCENEPIFIEDIKECVVKYYNDNEKDKVSNNIKVILNRLTKENKIKVAYKGIYYIPKTNVFGEAPLSIRKIINNKYLFDKDGGIKGYITGAALFNHVGLTTQVPNIIDIATNECKNNNKYANEFLNTVIRKPKIKITSDNYLYLQFFDLIENKDNINIEIKNVDDLLYNFICDNELNFEKIIMYARETNSKKVLKRIIMLAR